MGMLRPKIPHLWSGKVGIQTPLVSGSKASLYLGLCKGDTAVSKSGHHLFPQQIYSLEFNK